jgi:exopolyphosphatase/guanosine-5'-triphosphate,3'-diphosphate pyrophosphatase
MCSNIPICRATRVTISSLLAALVRRHRRSFPADAFAHLPSAIGRAMRVACAPCCDLAVVLHRGRSNEPLPAISLRVERQRMYLSFPPDWLDEHPLTHADLQMEARLLCKAGFELRLGRAAPAAAPTPLAPLSDASP